MIKVSVFGKQDCDACKAAVEKVAYFSEKWGKAEETSISFIDMETPDGLAEGAYRDVYDIPTVILEDDGQEVARWIKEVPMSKDFGRYFLKESVNEQS
jgi:thiol-disulfide isomerase/thioredoxin